MFNKSGVPDVGDAKFLDGAKQFVVDFVHFPHAVGGDVSVWRALFAGVGVETRE